jgi:hypothetical protein
MSTKEKLKGLFRDNPATPEGKYLVKRRDGTVVEWPSFVLGARDPVSPWALRAYAIVSFLIFRNYPWSRRIWRMAGEWSDYRRQHGTGDPDRGPHRKDDPITIAEMRRGYNA